jgi:5-methylthioadenosine/S-adenosylhomocysteine deaminase
MWPVHDPYSTVIMQSNVGNVETVMIAGQLPWSDTERVKRDLGRSGKRIVSELGIPTQLNG